MMVLDVFYVILWVMWWILSIGSAYVDWFQLGSMDFDFTWGTDGPTCGVLNIISNLNEILLSPNAVTLREIHVKCACEMANCQRVPMEILKKIALPFNVVLLRIVLRGNWMFFVCFEIWKLRSCVTWFKACFRSDGLQSGVTWFKACFRSDGVESRFAWFKASFRSDGVQSGVACVKVSFGGAGFQPKLSDEDFDKIILRLQKGLHRPSHAFDERMGKRMSDLLLCIPDYAIGTRWGIRMGSAEDVQKGIEMKDEKLLTTVQRKYKMCFSGQEWSSHCKEKITLDHYMRYENFLYYPKPLDFGRKEDLNPILDALKDAAFRVELEKQPDLWSDILALHA
jgi:hypothetical protein